MKITFEFENVENATSFMNHVSAYFSVPADEGETTKAPEADEKVDPPKTGRRGRPAKQETEKKGRRRGRPAKEEGEAPKSAKEGGLARDDSDISDAEASKAASEAAKELTVQVVLDELHKHNVEKVSELDQPKRKEFVERLRELLNAADAKNPAFG